MSERKIFEKIVSGGQTGADQGALDAALSLNHPCGGWCPKGRLSETGRIPERYPVTEHSSSEYTVRTEANVVDSDGTLIFTYGQPTGGTKLTVEMAEKHDKPHYVFDFADEAQNHDLEVIRQWGQDYNVYVLNVAGPKESKNPGTHSLVRAVMLMLLESARR